MSETLLKPTCIASEVFCGRSLRGTSPKILTRLKYAYALRNLASPTRRFYFNKLLRDIGNYIVGAWNGFMVFVQYVLMQTLSGAAEIVYVVYFNLISGIPPLPHHRCYIAENPEYCRKANCNGIAHFRFACLSNNFWGIASWRFVKEIAWIQPALLQKKTVNIFSIFPCFRM